jgi:hypothetical protein
MQVSAKKKRLPKYLLFASIVGVIIVLAFMFRNTFFNSEPETGSTENNCCFTFYQFKCLKRG